MTRTRIDGPLGSLSKSERAAYLMDAWRTWPRALLLMYVVHALYVAAWFMGLKEASAPQAAFVSTVWGAMPFMLNFYSQNGIDWERRISERFNQMNHIEQPPPCAPNALIRSE